MKICPKCNSLCEDSASFCQECGAPLPTPNDNAHTQENQTQQESQFQQNAYYQTAYQNNYNQNNYYQSGSTAGIIPRNLVLAIVFSFLTCGIYSIYWMIKLNDEVNQLAGEPQATSGGMVFLFSLITCGIYGIYWAYKMGERCDRIRGIQGNSSILYLVLSILGLDIVYFCLLQDMINKEVS